LTQLPSPEEVLKDVAKRVVEVKPNRKGFVVERERFREAVERLLRAYGEERVFVSTVVGVDRPQDGVIEVDYFINIIGLPQMIFLRVELPRDDPRMPTAVDLLPSAHIGEAEAHDLLGIVFEGNPHLKRPVFAPDEIVEKGLYPLRKDVQV